MVNFLYAFTLIVVLTPLTVLGFYYWKFRHSAACLWRNRVRNRVGELRSEIEQPDRFNETQSKAAFYYNDLFSRHLQSIPASAIEGYPGIGRGTVNMLLSSGLPTLAHLVGYDYTRIYNIGPKKALELHFAVSKLWADAKGRFETGACPEGQEYRRLWAEMSAADRAENDARLQKNAVIEDSIAAMHPLEVLADDITFWNHLLNQGDVPGLTVEILDRPLPDGASGASAHKSKPFAEAPIGPSIRISSDEVISAQTVNPGTESGDIFRQALQQSSPPVLPAGSQHLHLPKLKAYCAFALVIARADGRIAKSERQRVRDLLASAFGHDTTLLRFIDPLMEQTEKDDPDEDETIAEIRRLTSPKERKSLYSAAERIVDASGDRNAREVEALIRIASALEISVSPAPLAGRASDGVRSESSEAPVAPAPAPQPSLARPANEPRSILGIDPAAPLSAELIRRRFLLLTERADPAKAAALGPEFAAMAEAKRADLRRAALQLIEPFGEPLDAPAAPAPPADLRHNPDLDDVFGA